MQFDIIQHSAHVVGKCVIAYGAEGKAHGGKMLDTILPSYGNKTASESRMLYSVEQ